MEHMNTRETEPSSRSGRTHRRSPLLQQILFMKELSGLIMVVVVIGIFYALSPTFLDPRNIQVVLRILPELGILVIGVSLLMISGEFDLSVGSVFALAPILNGLLLNSNWDPLVAFILPLLVCLGIGAINGIVTTKLGIPSFITTLGAMMVWRGVVLLISDGWPFPWVEAARPYANVLTGDLGFIRMSVLWYLGLIVVFWIMLERTRFGNWMFAVGGNPEKARALGINPDRVKIINFAIVSFLAGLAGMAQYLRVESAMPTAGFMIELDAIAASVIGGTALFGGAGSVIGGLIGSVLIRILDNGLILAGAPSYWFRVFVGLLLVAAVVLNRIVEKRIEKEV